MTPTPTLRQRIHRHLDPEAWPHDGLSPANAAIALLIVLCAALAILESEPVLREGREALFTAAAHGFGLLFLGEWLLRLWAAPEARPDLAPGRARRAQALSAGGVIDLLALLPFLLDAAGAESLLLRLLRILLLVRLARLGRFSQALRLLGEAVSSRRDELLAGLAAAAALLVLASALLHLAEREAQPDDFGSIPRAMWWAIATLTTAGGRRRDPRDRPHRHAHRDPRLRLQRRPRPPAGRTARRATEALNATSWRPRPARKASEDLRLPLEKQHLPPYISDASLRDVAGDPRP